MRFFSTIGLAALIAATPAVAAASEFLVIVPVEIRNAASSAREGTLTCTLFDTSGAAMGDPQMTDFALKNGAFSGRVRVKFEPAYPAGSDATLDGASVRCGLTLQYNCTTSTGPSVCQSAGNLAPASGGAAARRGFEAAAGASNQTTVVTRWDPATVRVVAGSIAP